LKESLGGLGNLVVLRLNVAAQLLGLSKAQAGRILPSVELGPNSAGVTLGDLQHAIASRRKVTDRTRGGAR
ncbi:MAG: hypothetical protein JWO82_1658, partial [Akkermansiaceae bacterium]|nr:hypothetical protein [Akkermansiaceae bacterium]